MTTSIYTNERWRPLHIRDTFLFERGNVKGFATQGGETGTSEVISANSNPGGHPDVPFVIGVYSAFGDSSLSAQGAGIIQPGNIRMIDSEALFNAGTLANSAIVSLPSGQSIATIRGCASIAQYTTFGNGGTSGNNYLYGVQGKVFVQGTVNASSGFVAALFGQLDTSGSAATVTSGYVSALQLDMGAASNLSSGSAAFVNAATILNTTLVAVNSAIKIDASLTYLFDLTDAGQGGSAWIVTAAVGGSNTKKLKVNIAGTTFYIPLYTA
jgi:hypothetical protein